MHHEYVSIGSQNSSHRLILLHGWGADTDDLIPVGKSIIHNLHLEFELISLAAPSFRQNDTGRQWYSLFPPDWNEAEIAVDKLLDTLNAFNKTKISLKKTVLLGRKVGALREINSNSKHEL